MMISISTKILIILAVVTSIFGAGFARGYMMASNKAEFNILRATNKAQAEQIATLQKAAEDTAEKTRELQDYSTELHRKVFDYEQELQNRPQPQKPAVCPPVDCRLTPVDVNRLLGIGTTVDSKRR